MELQSADRELWRSFRQAYERIGSVIERELLRTTQLSGADHGILSRLAEAPEQRCRQQELANSMRWDRTRLSHHLKRMEERGLVTRTKVAAAGSQIAITAHGDTLRRMADPVHAELVMTHFIARLSSAQRTAISTLGAGLDDADAHAAALSRC